MGFLEFKEVKKRFGKKEVLSGISFGIEKKDVFGLIGRSGCGKSVLLKILIGMVKADAGQILFDGRNVLRNLNYLRKKTGFATQDNMLFNELSIKENCFYFGRLYGLKKRDIKSKFKELIGLLELDGFENAFIENLSGGMAKRANLLVSLIHSPELLVLDEPTVGLDPILRKSLWEYVRTINACGTTILVTSHLLDEIEENCNKVAVLKKGKVISMASIEDYKEAYGKNKSFEQIFREIQTT